MSKKKNNDNIVGFQLATGKSFDDYRNLILENFKDENIFFKRKLSQGAFWTSIDKDLANQFFRDERWLFNMKYKDEIKLIDHGVEPIEKSGIGFTKTK